VQTDTRIRVVQFLHPGGENRPHEDGRTEWSRIERGHARKFLQHRGRYVDGVDASPQTDELHFWAEWEPGSTLIRALPKMPPLPQYLVRPILERMPTYSNLNNTDPFVFGDRFYYSNCKLRGKMTELARGSVILFGSNKDGGFVLDTVFVVDGSLDRTRANYRSLLLPTEFVEATLEPLYAHHSASQAGCADGCPDETDDSRLYIGATQGEPFERMFSFFPCVPARASNGFARPTIQNWPFVSNTLQQNLQITECDSINEARTLWQDIVRQVRNTRVDGEPLRLGVFADLPERAG
jgi:hypothetical protein